MKKQKMLAWVLAVSMMSSSMPTVYAQDVALSDVIAGETEANNETETTNDEVEVNNEVEVNDETEITDVSNDDVTSDSAVELTEETNESKQIVHQVTEPWKGSVFGDAGGAEGINNNNYNIAETDKGSVNMRAGIFDVENNKALKNVGKISKDSDGIAMYFRELKAEQNFTLTATANIVSCDTTNNQVSFGLMARDNMLYDSTDAYDASFIGNYAAAGRLNMKDAGSTSNSMTKAFYREDKKLYNASTNPELASTAAAPVIGESVKLSLTKSGNIFTCKVGDEEPVTINLALTDDMYVGPFVSRCAEINFTDVSLVIEGEVEVGDWQQGWTGVSTSGYSITEDGDNLNLKITKENTGKISDDEDSFAYYVKELPVAADYEVSAKVKVNSYNVLPKVSSQNQSGFGIIIADRLHSRVVNNDDKYANNLMLQSYMTAKGDATAYFQASERNGAKRTYLNKFTTSFPSSGNDLGTYDLKIVKSGDSYVFTCNDESFTYTADDIFSDTVFPGFFVARDADITLTDFKVEVDNRVAKSIILNKKPTKTEYIVGEELDLTGIEVKVVYDDGSSAIIDDYVATGFDKNKVGKQTVSISKGSASASFDVDVRALKIEELGVTKPVKNEYFAGTKFISSGLSVAAKYEDGTSAILKPEEYALFIDGKEIDDSFYFTPDIIGNKTVEVVPKDTETVDANGKTNSFNITVKKGEFKEIKVASTPVKTEYFLNDELNTAGMIIRAYFDVDGTTVFDTLTDSEYTVTDFDSSKVGNYNFTITSNYNGLKTTQAYTVSERIANKLVVSSYPRMTLEVGEEFDPTEMVIKTYYNNAETEVTNEYTIDTSNFDSSEVGTTTVTIVPNNTSFSPIVLTLTITEPNTHYWKSLSFGQSSNGVDGAPATAVSNSGKSTDIMTEGKLGDVSVDLNSWDNAGKITGDHDGIAYYYTRVDAKNNFTVTADITVNQYMQGNKDESRSGQEAFGIMARDVIPLKAKSGFGDSAGMTAKIEEAEIDEYGEPVGAVNNSSVFASNIALAGGYSGTKFPNDPTASSYYKNANINRMNLYIRTGVNAIDGGGVKHGPFNTTEHVPKIGDKYRVTLTKINGGMNMTCTELTGEAAGTTKSYSYFFDGDTELAKDFLAVQDKNNIYVGFFAARWANITVDNISLYETDPATDPNLYDAPEEVYSPNLSLLSNDYTSDTNYNLSIKSSNPSGGIVTVKLGDKILYSGQTVTKRATIFPMTLEANKTNDVTILYTPSKGDNLSSYDDVVVNYKITHREFDTSKDIIYVAPDGKVDGDGTRENPYDFDTALGFIQRGQKMILLEGVYKRTAGTNVVLTNSGTKSKMKYMWADEGADVVFDMQGQYEGFTFTGSYWHVKGIDFRNSGPNLSAFNLGGSNCIIEDCKFYNNGETGMQISRTYSTEDFNEWPANNLVLNCEAYNNCDPSKNNADGFGCKLTVGNGNIFRGCVSHHNLDDGWDLYTKLATGAIGETILENCISYKQGYKINDDGTEGNWNGPTGHNGFKMGGENIPVKHYLKDCYSFMNQLNGVSTNSNPALKIRNVISYNNEKANYALYTDKPERYDYDIRGAISYINGNKDGIGTLTENKDYTNASGPDAINNEYNYFIVEANNTSVNSKGEKVDDSFFKSLNYDAVVKDGRLSQDSTGAFILGDFLARTDEHSYTHLEEDLITETPTEAPTETTTVSDVTETTTSSSSNSGSSSSGSSGGGSGSSSSKGSSEKTVADKPKTKEDTTEDTSKNTTSSSNEPTKTLTFVTSSGLTITPPTKLVNVSKFNDINSRPWAVSAIEKLAGVGIVNGVGNGKFAPDNNSKRADFVVMLIKTLGINDTAKSNFSDVSSNKYYANAVGLAKELGITTGSGNNKFNPESTITRQDMMVLTAKVLEIIGAIDLDNVDVSVLDKYADSNKIADYAKVYVAALIQEHIVNGTGNNIEPTAPITRAQMSVIIANVYDMIVEMAQEAEAVKAVAEEEVEDTTETDTTTAEEEVEDTTETDTTTAEEETEETTKTK